MLESLIKNIWKKLPYIARLKIVRLTQQKYTASVVGFITNEKNEVLVLDHLLRPGASWGLPGGFLDPKENPEDALRREIMEETGLELDNIQLLRVRTVRQHIEIIFRAEGIGKAEIKSREIVDLGWFPVDQLPDKMSQTQIELIQEILHK